MSHTTLRSIAILAAATLVTATFAAAAAHAFASIDAGNTLTKQKNYGKALASWCGTKDANVQQDCISVASGPC